ncbi:MAG: DUF5343 domain-containing protein [Eubacterium sp.]
MSLTNAYLQTTKNLQSIINSVVSAKAPERFTNKFLEDLGFKSSNDRLYISLFKALGLLDENSAPTSRYHQLLDQAETGKVLAVGIQDAYEDLFALRKDAQKLTIDEVKGKLKTLTQGQKSDNIIQLMANTFKALCDIADWNSPQINPEDNTSTTTDTTFSDDTQKQFAVTGSNNSREMNLHYNIQIHLPETTNMAVYDAIFQSLKKHLM